MHSALAGSGSPSPTSGGQHDALIRALGQAEGGRAGVSEALKTVIRSAALVKNLLAAQLQAEVQDEEGRTPRARSCERDLQLRPLCSAVACQTSKPETRERATAAEPPPACLCVSVGCGSERTTTAERGVQVWPRMAEASEQELLRLRERLAALLGRAPGGEPPPGGGAPGRGAGAAAAPWAQLLDAGSAEPTGRRPPPWPRDLEDGSPRGPAPSGTASWRGASPAGGRPPPRAATPPAGSPRPGERPGRAASPGRPMLPLALRRAWTGEEPRPRWAASWAARASCETQTEAPLGAFFAGLALSEGGSSRRSSRAGPEEQREPERLEGGAAAAQPGRGRRALGGPEEREAQSGAEAAAELDHRPPASEEGKRAEAGVQTEAVPEVVVRPPSRRNVGAQVQPQVANRASQALGPAKAHSATGTEPRERSCTAEAATQHELCTRDAAAQVLPSTADCGVAAAAETREAGAQAAAGETADAAVNTKEPRKCCGCGLRHCSLHLFLFLTAFLLGGAALLGAEWCFPRLLSELEARVGLADAGAPAAGGLANASSFQVAAATTSSTGSSSAAGGAQDGVPAAAQDAASTSSGGAAATSTEKATATDAADTTLGQATR